MDPEREKLIRELEADGHEPVRQKYKEGRYGDRRGRIVAAWLDQKVREAQEDADRRRERREEKALTIAERAETRASHAFWVSVVSAVAAILAAIAALHSCAR